MNKRNYGVDFLRIISMFMVVVLHILGQGGILDAATPQSAHYWTAWLLEISCYCAVNCFALISGFVMYRSKPRISKAINLWLQTIFYTISIAIVFFIIRPEGLEMRKTIMNALFPITRNHYWYITSYFGLLILLPVLNTAINHMTKQAFGGMLLFAFIFYILFPIPLLSDDPYILKGGCSVIWLSLMYLAGSYISKYNISNQVSTPWAWFVAIGSLLLTFLTKFVLETFPQCLPISISGWILISYTSPTILLIAISLLIICSKQRINKPVQSLVRILSPAALGVYLIHTNKLIWTFLIGGFAKSFINYNCVKMVLLVLLSAVAIYLICTLIELVRIKLFKLLKVDRLSEKIEKIAHAASRHSNETTH